MSFAELRNTEGELRAFQLRLGIVGFVVLAAFGLLLARLIWLQVLQHDAALPASRQEILGEARDRIERTREVVFDLLAFMRPLRLARLAWPAGVVLDALCEAVSGHPDAAEVTLTRALEGRRDM